MMFRISSGMKFQHILENRVGAVANAKTVVIYLSRESRKAKIRNKNRPTLLLNAVLLDVRKIG